MEIIFLKKNIYILFNMICRAIIWNNINLY